MVDDDTPINAEDRKVGPIPLPWFIGLCIFTPCFLAILGYSIHLHTVKMYKDKKQLASEITVQNKEAGKGEAKAGEVSQDIKMQVRAFVNAPLKGK